MRDYLEYLRIPGVKPLLFASTFGRFAYSMVSLAIFFQVEDVTQSVGTAGLAVGISAGLGALTAGPRGHLVDRFGQTRPLLAFVPAYAISCLLLATLGQGAVMAVLLSGLIGLTAPPLNISIRPLWLDIVGQQRVRMAYSVDTAYANLIMLLGPVVSTLVALHFSPRLAIAAVGFFMLVGGILLAVNPHSRAWVPEDKDHGEHGLLRSPAMRLLALEGAAMGLAAGFVTIGIPAAATLSGQQELTGPVMAAMGVGVIIGTIWAGAKAKDIAPANGLRASTFLFAIALLPLPFVPVGPWMMLVVMVAWAFLGPANVFYLETIDVVRPRGTAVAALGTLWMIEGSAAAVGNAVGGNVAVWIGPQATLALGCFFVIFSPLIFTVGIRGVLKPASSAAPRESWAPVPE
ncbi:MAG: MFS transporter [Actinomycetota bacterium]|nr:MFS transporter [Actinomycetota bacterium]